MIGKMRSSSCLIFHLLFLLDFASSKGGVGVGVGDVFSSSGSLARIFKLEHEVVKVLNAHKEQLEKSLEAIRYYSSTPEYDIRLVFLSNGRYCN